MINYKLPHPSECKDCNEFLNSEHGYLEYLADSKDQYIHGRNCAECDRIGQKQMAHLLRYGFCKTIKDDY